MAGFEVRRWEALTEAMIDWIQGNPDLADGVLATDLVVGSLERSHLEALALLMEEYDVRAAQAIAWAVPEAAFWAFGFDQLPAKSAIGSVVFTALVAPLADISIPIGTRVMTPQGLQFQTITAGTLSTGAFTSAAVSVQAVDAGPGGNVAAGTITKLLYPIAGIDGASNSLQTTGGANVESDTDRRMRFAKWIRTLVRGTTDALEFAAMETGVISAALSVDPFMISPMPDGVPYAGLNWLFVDDGAGTGTLNPAVKLAVKNAVYGWTDPSTGVRIPGWKAAGIRVDILPVAPVFVKVRATVSVSASGAGRWSQISANLSDAARRFFATIPIGGKVSYQNLVVTLTAVDPEIKEVDLVLWKSAASWPGYTDSVSADDILVVDSTSTYGGIGNRAYLQDGAVTESGGPTVTYPEWIMA